LNTLAAASAPPQIIFQDGKSLYRTNEKKSCLRRRGNSFAGMRDDSKFWWGSGINRKKETKKEDEN